MFQGCSHAKASDTKGVPGVPGLNLLIIKNNQIYKGNTNNPGNPGTPLHPKGYSVRNPGATLAQPWPESEVISMYSNIIVQIMPAPKNLFAVVYDDCGCKVEKPCICLGLTELGQILFIYLDGGIVAKTKEGTISREITRE